MKKLLFFLALIFTFTNLNPILAHTESDTRFVECEKTYVSPDRILVLEEGIFVLFHGGWIQTGGIASDAQGIFFTSVQVFEEATRICPRCNAENSHYRKTCAKCGAQLI